MLKRITSILQNLSNELIIYLIFANENTTVERTLKLLFEMMNCY